MSEKSELQKPAEDILINAGIEYLHIPNSAFRGKKYFNVNLPKNFPDLMFLFKGKLYMRELGIMGSNMDRKTKQREYMEHWEAQGANIGIIYTLQELYDFFMGIGMI